MLSDEDDRDEEAKDLVSVLASEQRYATYQGEASSDLESFVGKSPSASSPPSRFFQRTRNLSNISLASSPPSFWRKNRPALTLGSGTQAASQRQDIFARMVANGYEMGRCLSAGSSGTTLRVLKSNSERRLLKCAFADELIQRLAKEYHLLKRVGGHDNIVQIFEWQMTRDGSGFVMAFNEGVTLFKFYKETTFDPVAQWPHRLASQLMDAVAHLHSLSIVHRDLHSQNVMVENGDDHEAVKAVLIDFGSATMRKGLDDAGAPHRDALGAGADVTPQSSRVSIRMSSSCVARRDSNGRRNSGSSCVARRDSTSRRNSGGERSEMFSSLAQSECKSELSVQLQSESDRLSYADEWTMPNIMPPELLGGDGPGSAYQLDVFAVGLLLAGLARARNTETRDIYNSSAEVKARWQRPAPPLSNELEELILTLIHLDPTQRRMASEAKRLLPAPGCWYRIEPDRVEHQ